MEKLPLSKAYRLIEPGPVILLTTARRGKPNIMTMSCTVAMSVGEPIFGIMMGPWDYSYETFLKTKECTIAIPTVDLAEKAMDIGNTQGGELDKFKHFGLTPLAASKIKAPLIKECLANLECRLEDETLADKYGLFVVKAVAAWVDNKRKERRTLHHNGDGTFTVDGELLNFKDRMTRWPDHTV